MATGKTFIQLKLSLVIYQLNSLIRTDGDADTTSGTHVFINTYRFHLYSAQWVSIFGNSQATFCYSRTTDWCKT